MLQGRIAASKVMLMSRLMLHPLKAMGKAAQPKHCAITLKTLTSVKEKENARSTVVLVTSATWLQHKWPAPSFWSHALLLL